MHNKLLRQINGDIADALALRKRSSLTNRKAVLALLRNVHWQDSLSALLPLREGQGQGPQPGRQGPRRLAEGRRPPVIRHAPSPPLSHVYEDRPRDMPESGTGPCNFYWFILQNCLAFFRPPRYNDNISAHKCTRHANTSPRTSQKKGVSE